MGLWVTAPDPFLTGPQVGPIGPGGLCWCWALDRSKAPKTPCPGAPVSLRCQVAPEVLTWVTGDLAEVIQAELAYPCAAWEVC